MNVDEAYGRYQAAQASVASLAEMFVEHPESETIRALLAKDVEKMRHAREAWDEALDAMDRTSHGTRSHTSRTVVSECDILRGTR